MTMALVSFLMFVGFGFFIYFQAKRNNKVEELKVVDNKLTEDQKKSEQEVKDVKAKLEVVKNEQKNLTPEQIEDFWKKN